MISEKILTREEVAAICREARAQGRKVGFTSGAFDLLHAGHADFLERARALCDLLVVGVNSDTSVRRYKGSGRPIVPERQRAELVAALESVNHVFLFSERRNAKNIEEIQPDLYIKAGDYAKSELTSAEIVEKYGGRAIVLEIRTPVSTTEIARRAAASLESGQRAVGSGQRDEDGEEDSGPAIGNPQSKIRNPKSEIPNPQSAIRNPQSSILNPKSAIPNPQSEITDPSPICLEMPPPKTAPAVFLDRDGTINKEVGHLHDPAMFELLPGAAEGLKRFAEMGYRIVIITNQNGIGLGYFTRHDFYKVNSAMFRALRPYEVVIDRIYFCPHSVNDGCDCRKPGLALIERAREDLNLDLAHSVFIGDRTRDVETGRRAGMTAILLKTGAAGSDGEFDARPDYVAEDLPDAVRWVLERERAECPPSEN